jgi:homoserine O-acetyltransferase
MAPFHPEVFVVAPTTEVHARRAVASFQWLPGAVLAALASAAMLLPAWPARAGESDFVIRDFQFRSGEKLPELKLHVLTLGKLVARADGHSNAVLILHGTGGTGRQFLAPQFAGVLYGAGAPLDTTKFFIVLPDGIGHGRSSKPSDGPHIKFPHYDYDDMVEAQYRLVTEHLGIKHLRLVMGTSMGAMHTFVWAEAHPDFMDALMPLACLPTAIVGRNRLWRSMVVDAIEHDPAWNAGEYSAEPAAGLRTAVDLLILAGSAPIAMQNALSSRDSVDHWLSAQLASRLATTDANDLIYQVEASRHYDPSGSLEKIRAPLVQVNSADDFINPPELAIAEKLITRVPGGKFVLIPAGPDTHGHGTHTWAALWKQHLVALLAASESGK